MRRRRATHALLSLGVLIACSSRGAAPAPAPLENTTWRLAELAGSPAIGAEGERAPRLEFADSGRIGGSTGCNRVMGSFTRSGETLRFGPTATTRMACVDPRLGLQERAFLAALDSTERHRIEGDTLVLIGRSATVARFVRATGR